MVAKVTEMLVDAGNLGEIELTIYYTYTKPHNGRGREPDEPASAIVHRVKVGGVLGADIEVPESFMPEVVAHCVDDWEGDGCDVDVLIDRMKDERAERAAA